MIAESFIEQGHPISLVLKILGLPRGAYYYQPSKQAKSKGKSISQYTKTISGGFVDNQEVVNSIKSLLEMEFVDYGYRKVTHWLRQEKGYIINEKKVYRIMKDNKLLNHRVRPHRTSRQWVKELVPKPLYPFEYIEIDIKYIYIAGQRRYGLLLTAIDVTSRWVLDQILEWNINQNKVIQLFDRIFSTYHLPERVYVRNDNGSQFEAITVQQYFADHKIIQEFTKPATPEQNAHIESYHSIVESVICRQYDFDSMEEAKETFTRFKKFYNFERIHSGTGYLSPYKYLFQKGIDLKVNQSPFETRFLSYTNLNPKVEYVV